jgi:hypothetical protein
VALAWVADIAVVGSVPGSYRRRRRRRPDRRLGRLAVSGQGGSQENGGLAGSAPASCMDLGLGGTAPTEGQQYYEATARAAIRRRPV